MSDDWLQHGHETDDVELTRVLSSSSVLANGVSPPARFTAARRGVIIGSAIAVAATLGVVGVANAISDNLFPSPGATSPASVWQNPVPPDEPVPDADVAPSPTSSTSIPAIAPTTPPTQPEPSTTVAAPALSPTPSTPKLQADDDADDDDVVVTTTLLPQQADDNEPDDTEPDDGSSDDASGSGDSSGSGSSGSDDSGSGSGSDDD